MNGTAPKAETMEEKLASGLPHMQRNLHEMEMKHAWLLGEVEKLKTAIENQRGAILWTERLLAPDINEVVAGMQEAPPLAPPPPGATPRPPFQGQREGGEGPPISMGAEGPPGFQGRNGEDLPSPIGRDREG